MGRGKRVATALVMLVVVAGNERALVQPSSGARAGPAADAEKPLW